MRPYLALTLLPFLGIPLAAGYLVPPPTTAAPGTTQDCSKWVTYSSDLTCASIEADNSITEEQFEAWNPITAKLGSSCTLIAGFDYCVQINYGSGSGSASPTTTPSPTTFTMSTITTTTTSGNGISTPSPTHPGMVDNCNKFYDVADGDSCQSTASDAGISLSDFYTWNSGVGSDCSSLWLGYYVCVGVVGGATTPPPPTTTDPGNGVATPTPTQAGMVDNCNAFHFVESGDNCFAIAKEAGISLSNFYSWNPGVGDGCSSLWLGYYVCIGVMGKTPPTTTTSTPGNGITTPTPIQAGMVDNCDAFHSVESGDTCAAIAKAAGVSLSDFYKWNPGVGSDCSSLWLGYYVCTSVIGAKPTPTTTKPGNGVSTPTPTQAGMVDNCNRFYDVSKGDTCASITKDAGISLKQFEKWNPGVGSDCKTLWLGYYVCIGIV